MDKWLINERIVAKFRQDLALRDIIKYRNSCYVYDEGENWDFWLLILKSKFFDLK